MGFIDLPRDIRYSSDLKSEEGGSETRYSANIALLPTHEHPPKLSNSFFLNIPRGIYVHLALCIFNALLVLILLVIFQGGLNDRERDLTCTKRLNQPSPASEAVEYEIQQFKGGLTARSIWSGNPGAEVDEAWHSITETGYFGLPEEVWKGLNPHSEEAVRLSNGQYLATLDVFHKLHCVDLLRRAVHFKYYHDKYPAFQNLSDATITAHLGHCIEILRMNVMCEADTTVMTYNWVEDRPEPMPYFDTVHTCRRWEGVMDWMNRADVSHEILPMKAAEQKELPRAKGEPMTKIL